MKLYLLPMAILFLAGPTLGAKLNEPRKVLIEVTESGFTPKSIDVKPGTNVSLVITRKTDSTCSTEIQIPSKKMKVALPLNEPITIALGTLEKGEVRFGCGMDLDNGKILVR